MNSMASAISLALDMGHTIPPSVVQWPKTYGATPEDFMREWDRQLSARSLKPSNSFEDGK